MVLLIFCPSSKAIKWKPMFFLVPGPMEMFAVCFNCLLSLHPNIQMHVINSSDSEKALLKILSTCKNRLPWVQQMLTPITKLSPCPLTAQMIQLHWKQKGNESKETLMHLISWIWQLPLLQANQYQTIWTTSWNSLGLLSEQRQIFTDETMTEEEEGFCFHVWVKDQPCHDVIQCLMHLPDYLQACSALQSLQR